MSTHIFTPITPRFGYGKYLDIEIVIDSETRYINASKLCKQNGKKLSEWLRYDSNKQLVEIWSRLNEGEYRPPHYEITLSDLKGISKVNQDQIRGQYFHEDLLIMIAQWMSKEFAMKISRVISLYRNTLTNNLPTLNINIPLFITDKKNVNDPLNALNDLIQHPRKVLTEPPKAKVMKIESYEEILSRKVRKLYEEIMPPDYYQHIKDIDHPEDIREVLICMAGKLGIDIIVKEEEKYDLKSYEVYFQWNRLPLLLGYTDDERQAQITAGDWKYKEWVDKTMLLPYKDLKSNVRPRANIAASSSMDDLSSNNNDCSRAIIRNDTVYVNVNGLTKLLCKCEGLGYKNDMLQSWINTTIEVTKYYSQMAYKAHNEYNTNYTAQLRDLHYREIKAVEEIPTPDLTKGYLYIGTDPNHLAKCEYKLGMTTKPVKTRLSNSQTSNPEYYYIYSVEVKEPNEAEHILHTLLTKMGMKVTKEWFRLPSEEAAIGLLNKIVEITNHIYDEEYIKSFINSMRSLQMATS